MIYHTILQAGTMYEDQQEMSFMKVLAELGISIVEYKIRGSGRKLLMFLR